MGRPRETTDEEILDAARRVFLEHGPSVATSKIALELGISAPALFHRFGNKRGLLLAAVRPRSFPMLDALANGFDPARTVDEQLLAVAFGFRDFLRALLPVMSLMKSAGIDHSEVFNSFETPPPLIALERLDAFFEGAQASGVLRAATPRTLSLAFLGAVQGPVFLTFHLGRPVHPDLDAHLREMVHNFLNGVAK